jgi:hypothetical protein
MVFPTSSGNLVRYPFFLEKVWKPLLSLARRSWDQGPIDRTAPVTLNGAYAAIRGRSQEAGA